MSAVGIDTEYMKERFLVEPLEPEKYETNDEGGVYLSKVNGLHDEGSCPDDINDQLVQTIVEINCQNEYLKCQFEGLKNILQDSNKSYQQEYVAECNGGSYEDVQMLKEKIEVLSNELLEEKQTRGAAEEALTHLRVEYSEADEKNQELSAKLEEAKKKLDQELKERDGKYSELDSKFSRLHKRAKQRIQEVQKEKDDLEAKFNELTQTAEQTATQQSTLQQDLERTRQQANEALKAIDADRQQLRAANNKLRENIDELRRSLEPKESALEALQQSLLEKEQILEDMHGLLQAAEEKRQASIAELSAKHQRQLDSLEAQLSDTLSDRNKAAATISSLQSISFRAMKCRQGCRNQCGRYGMRCLLLKEILELQRWMQLQVVKQYDLRASVETVKGELLHLRHEHEKEKQSWEAATLALKTKLEAAESNCIRAEIESAKNRSQLEYEASVQTRLLHTRDSDLAAAREEIGRLESDFASYKARAHALLQKKDAEIAASQNSERLEALEEALKEAEKEVALASSEKDRALQDLQNALANHDEELARRDAALNSAKQQTKSLETKIASENARYRSEREAWEVNIRNLEESWKSRCEALKAQNEVSSGQDLLKEMEELKLQLKKLKGENESFRDLADRMMEEKDAEISRLLDDNKSLQQTLELMPPAGQNGMCNTASQKQDATNLSNMAAEQQILVLARLQAQREEELSQSQRHILALQEELEELECENRLHYQQEAMLKEEMRNMERMQKREGVDMTYLKNVIVKLLETGEVEALLPVVGMLLQFSPDELQKCHQAYRESKDVQSSPASDTQGSSSSLFSRFSFS